MVVIFKLPTALLLLLLLLLAGTCSASLRVLRRCMACT
jgi:hypothetical protein